MSKASFALVCIIIIPSATLLPLVSADWPMYRSDPSHSGAGTSNPNVNNILEPAELWQTYLQFPQSLVAVPSLPGFVPSEARSITEPVVVDGVAYVVSGVVSPNSNQQLYAIGPPAQPSPKSGAAIPDLPWLIIVPLILSIFSVAVILRHRKTANPKH